MVAGWNSHIDFDFDGNSSQWTPVVSGVPQGTVLGPILFLCYINDITEDITSNISLFADDDLLYRQINNDADKSLLQKDLETLEQWSSRWLLNFNVSKCVHLRIRPARLSPANTEYMLNSQSIPILTSTKYLGIEIHENLSWGKHLQNISTKANQTLGAIRRHFSKATLDVKKRLYLSLVRPQLEYACAAWDPYKQKDIHQLEMHQNRAARFIFQDYQRTSSVTFMKRELNLEALEDRRRKRRLQCFFDYRRNSLVLNNFPSLTVSNSGSTRSSTQHQEVIKLSLQPNTDHLKYSFLYRVIKEWNQLDQNTIGGSRYNFKTQLARDQVSGIT